MARKPDTPQPGNRQSSTPQPPRRSDREKIIDAFMGLLAERPIEEIGFGDIAGRAGVSLSTCREEFGSVLSILAAFIKSIDRQVLSGGDAELAQEPPRERLFDVLMRRLELLTPHKAAVRSLQRSACRNPGLAFALNGLSVRSQTWMLTAADIDATGLKGMVRAQGMAMLFARALATFVNDDEPGLPRTMAALDRELARGQRWSGFLDDGCRLTPPACCPGSRRPRRRQRDEGEEAIAI